MTLFLKSTLGALVISFALHSHPAFALQYEKYELDLVEPVAGSCSADYQKYHHNMALKAGLVLPVSIVGGAVLMFAGGSIGAALGRANDVTGWGALGGVISGLVITGAGSVIAYVTIQTDALVRLIRSGIMKRVIEQSYLTNRGAVPGKDLLRFHRKMIKNYPASAGRASPELTARIIVELDETRALCDGSLKKKQKERRNPKLKHLLATPSEAQKAVADHLFSN